MGSADIVDEVNALLKLGVGDPYRLEHIKQAYILNSTIWKSDKRFLEQLKEKHKIIREIRGKGLMIGIELKYEVKDILMDGIEKGVLLLYSGRNIIRLLPPLVISEEDITKVLETLDILLSAEEKRKNV